MKTITLTVNNRPGYLRIVLESLKIAIKDYPEYELFVGLEPGNDECREIVFGIDFIKTHIHINKEKKGVRNNPYLTIERAIESGSLFNICMEDDVILSSDAIHLSDWYLTNRNIESNNICLNLLNYNSENRPCELIKSRNFNALGIAFTRVQWELYFRHNWFDDSHNLPGKGWDWSINALLRSNHDLYVVEPVLARSNHIGRENGTFCNPVFHDINFRNLVISKDSTIKSFYFNNNIKEGIMPHSDTATHQFMVKEVQKHIKSRGKLKILDCGVGSGSIAASIRAKIARNKLKIIGLEIFEPYITDENTKNLIGKCYHDMYDEIITGEEGNFAHYLPQCQKNQYDIIIFGDSLEHVGPDWAEHSLHHALRVAKKAVIVNAPIVKIEQGAVFGNDWEAHNMFWTKKTYGLFGGAFSGGNELVGCFIWHKKDGLQETYKPKDIEVQSKCGPRFGVEGNLNYSGE